MPQSGPHARCTRQHSECMTILNSASKSKFLSLTAIYKCGNQLDCAKGTRVFLGFSANKLHILPPHTKLGSVPMRYLEKSICDRNLWWAHNSMDKIYLPITESYGPRSYDECTLLFEKTKNCFMISICSSVDASKY